MSYVIRNYGNSRMFPFKDKGVSIGRDGAIVTDDLEMVNALSGQSQISIVKQPGTVDVPPPAPALVEEEIDYESMLKRELLALCEERGLEVPKNATKAVIIELLIADDEKPDEADEDVDTDEDEEIEDEEDEDEDEDED